MASLSPVRGLIILLTALIMIAARNPVHGALLAYESFDYPDGSDITGQNGGVGWTNAWFEIGAFPSSTVAGSLTYTDQSGNKLVTAGNKLRNSGDSTGNNTSQPSRTLAHYFTATETNQTTWLSCLAQRFGTKDVDPNGGPDFYGRGANISMADTLQDSTQLTYRFTYGTHSGEMLDVWEVDIATPAFEMQSTNTIEQSSLLLFRVDHVTNTVDSVPNDTVIMWVNPPLGVEPSTNTAAAVIDDTELSFNHFEFFAGGANGTYLQAEWYVDEIRLGTTFTDVTPFTPGGGGPTVTNITVTNIQVNADKLALSFTTPQPASTHAIEQVAKLPASAWTNVANVTFSAPSGNTLVATFPTPSSAPAFYRVRLGDVSVIPTCVTTPAINTWTNSPFANQTNTFTATFDATPSDVAPFDVIMALSSGARTAFADFACLVRFQSAGIIDARNGANYEGPTPDIPFQANVTYHFRLVVNIPAKTYSVYVTEAGGTEQLVGRDFAFRPTAITPTHLNNWGLTYDIEGPSPPDSATVCNFKVVSP